MGQEREAGRKRELRDGREGRKTPAGRGTGVERMQSPGRQSPRTQSQNESQFVQSADRKKDILSKDLVTGWREKIDNRKELSFPGDSEDEKDMHSLMFVTNNKSWGPSPVFSDLQTTHSNVARCTLIRHAQMTGIHSAKCPPL